MATIFIEKSGPHTVGFKTVAAVNIIRRQLLGNFPELINCPAICRIGAGICNACRVKDIFVVINDRHNGAGRNSIYMPVNVHDLAR